MGFCGRWTLDDGEDAPLDACFQLFQMLQLMQIGSTLGQRKVCMPTLNEPLVPTEKEVLLAREFQRQICGMKFGKKDSIGLQVEGMTVSVPTGAFRMLVEAVCGMAEGKAVAMIPVDEEVSPQEAAGLLNVSRPFAARLFDEGAIPSRKVGTHRRALTRDVLAYRQREKEARLKVLDELAAEAQQLNMGY